MLYPLSKSRARLKKYPAFYLANSIGDIMYSKDDKKKVSEPSSRLFITEYVQNLGLTSPEDIKKQNLGLLGLMVAGNVLRRDQ